MSLKITERDLGKVIILNCEGRVTEGESSANLKDMVRSLVNKGKKFIILDFTNVGYIDSAGICALVNSLHHTRGQEGQLKLLKLAKRVADILQITGLYTAFEVFDNEAEAVESFALPIRSDKVYYEDRH